MRQVMIDQSNRQGDWEIGSISGGGETSIIFSLILNLTLPETNMAPENGWLEY